ncbi:MAG TPA: hypothetical protein ENK58_01410, partial [Desulfobacterales bacterium]|nr:hypothetical protein [Desulfobacterales bacterium]
MNTENKSRWIVRPIVPEDVYTDREEFLEYFYNAALAAAGRRTMSTVLLGQRRMGKTEIFKRVVNRLFFEQNPKDPEAVVPVYYSFPDAPMDERKFGTDYLENFLRHYLAFYTGNPKLARLRCSGRELVAVAEDAVSAVPSAETLDRMIKTLRSLENGDSVLPHPDALDVPRTVSDVDDTTIEMLPDEIQNTRLPQYKFDIAGFMQNAVESPTCPHIVTGPAMSILTKEIIGRGTLFGRFDSEVTEAMSGYWGKELTLKAAQYYKAEVSEVMAPVTAEHCGGNPFYITAVIKQAAKLRKPVSDEKTLNEILAVDLSSGFIWGELNDQVTRWIERINEHKITKWILYLSAPEENEEKDKKSRLKLERIQSEIKRREGTDVPLETIRDVLIRLSRGDLLEYPEMGNWFLRVKDPILLEFLKVWGRIEVEGHDQRQVQDELADEYRNLRLRVSEYKGYLAEVHMSQVLLDSQNRTLPGRFFNTGENVRKPWRFSYVRHRVRIGSGKGNEIDLLGAAGAEKWVCQSKWVTGRPIGRRIMEELAAQAGTVREDMNPKTLRMW